MGEFTIKMPDVGEGVAEAELVEWHCKVGDPVREDMILAAVMTDKATVEIPSPVTGTVLWLGAEVGDIVAVKAPLVRIGIAGETGDTQSDEAGDEAAGEKAGRAGQTAEMPEEATPEAAIVAAVEDVTPSAAPAKPAAAAEPVSVSKPAASPRRPSG